MNQYKIITLTGLDRVGKATQTALLHNSLQPSKTMSFPNYDSWSGKIIRSILREAPFLIGEETCEEFTLDSKSSLYTTHRYTCRKQPELFQCLQSIDRIAVKDEIKAGLRKHHYIMDRYEVDALAYGLADGCDIDWLLAMDKLFVPSDLAVIMVGEAMPRIGEMADINERDTGYQNQVRSYYETLAVLMPKRFVLFDVDHYRHDADPIVSIIAVQNGIRILLAQRLGITDFKPLTRQDVCKLLDRQETKVNG